MINIDKQETFIKLSRAETVAKRRAKRTESGQVVVIVSTAHIPDMPDHAYQIWTFSDWLVEVEQQQAPINYESFFRA